ncbi:MAG TPA: FliI/YscN family ATPase [Phycisphaerales bacterium]|nr:FliI/YscN family ATPase [Phycisphaerales bacterium]
MTALRAQLGTLDALQPIRVTGRVAALRGLIVLARDLPLPVGALVRIAPPRRRAPAARDGADPAEPLARGEVIGFDGPHAMVMTLGATTGISPGDEVVGEQSGRTTPVGPALLGRVIDALGRPLDGAGPVHATTPQPLEPEPLPALARGHIDRPLHTGVRALDLMTTLGRGQRLGIFAGPGVGKSTLLGWIARRASSDVNVVALIGERGREVGDFLTSSLGPEGLARSVVVVATGDQSPLMRVRAALSACAIAEYFRDRGDSVLLMMDSITRLAHAQRQIGLSVGEPPATRGYTPSVFALLPRVLERAGTLAAGPGSITGLYTVLVEGDDLTEPIADATRGILDGHLVLSRRLAQRGHYPALDVLDSVSRLADQLCDEQHLAARRQVVRLLAAYRDVEDLVQIGAYARGSSPEADAAIAFQPRLAELLQQAPKDHEDFASARARMLRLAIEAGAAIHQATRPLVAGRA